jgi:hypothetical protein
MLILDAPKTQLPPLETVASMFGQDLISGSDLVAIGSHAEGFQTPTSDVDLMAIGLADVIGGLASGDYSCRMIAGKRVQLGYLSATDFEQRTRLPSEGSWDLCSLRDAELIHKYVHAKVITTSGLHARLIAGFDQSGLVSLVRFIETKFLTDLYDDISGLLEVGQYMTAALLCRDLVSHAFDDLLAASGDTYCKPKWRVERAARLGGCLAEPLQRFLEYQLSGPGTEENDVEIWIAKSLLTCRSFQWQAMQAAQQLTPLHAPSGEAAREDMLQPVPHAFYFERDGKGLVRRRGQVFALPPCAGRAFLASHAGGSRAGLIEMLVQATGDRSSAYNKAFDNLVHIGLLQRSTSGQADTQQAQAKASP